MPTLLLSARAFTEIKTRLEQVEHTRGFREDPDGDLAIDLSDLVVRRIKSPGVDVEDTRIELASIVSHRTSRGMVELTVNAEVAQMDLDKAREVLGMLQGAIEAAITDELLLAFLTSEKVGLDRDSAGRALLDFREMRQGSRGTVYPH